MTKTITVCSHKGGVAKTTTALNLGAWLSLERGQQVAIIDRDSNRSAVNWYRRCPQAWGGVTVMQDVDAPDYFMANRPGVIIVDTPARPSRDDLEAIAAKSSLIIVPSTPDALGLETLPLLIQDLRAIGNQAPYKFLITRIPAHPRTDGADAQAFLTQLQQPQFAKGLREYSAYQKAGALGVPVGQARTDGGKKDPRAGQAWADIEALGKEVWGA